MTSVFQANMNVSRASATPALVYKQSGYPPQQQHATRPYYLVDDYEYWYSDPGVPNSRLVLALNSGIESEIGWSLQKLCKMCKDENFLLRNMLGLTDALFVWPDWYIRGGARQCMDAEKLFALPADLARQKRYALDSIFILRNASYHEENAATLAAHQKARIIILWTLHHMRRRDEPAMEISHAEFILYVIEMLQNISETLILPPPEAPPLANPVLPLEEMAEESSNRSLIIACLSTLNLLFANPANFGHVTPGSPALNAAVRYLGLFGSDQELAETSLNYLYTHLALPAMSKAFLLHPLLVPTLKLLVLVLKSSQEERDLPTPIDADGQAFRVYTAPAAPQDAKVRELSQADLERILNMQEPERCIEWLKAMFVANPDAETTQVDLWNLYRTTFSVPGHTAILQAQEVIKYASTVFSQATAMVLQGPQQRFVVRGIERAPEKSERFKCRWRQCEQDTPFISTADLYQHILEAHIDHQPASRISCSWGTCTITDLQKPVARGHVLTHVPVMQPPAKDPNQTNSITLPYARFPHPVQDPTTRPPPPPRNFQLLQKTPVEDPPSHALTALLCIRVLFRSSFASSDAAPRVDEDHFGFPGVVEDTREEDEEERHAETEMEKEGGRRGRKAFLAIRHLLEEVRIRDPALMGWITEMIEAGLTGTT